MRIYIRDFFTVFRIFSTPIYLFIIYLLNFLSTFFQRSRYSDDIGVKHVLYPLIPLNSTQCTLTVVCVCVCATRHKKIFLLEKTVEFSTVRTLHSVSRFVAPHQFRFAFMLCKTSTLFIALSFAASKSQQ